jgi:single-stranded DNA-binding protein
MNRVMLVGRLTRDPELRSLPSGKPVATLRGVTNSTLARYAAFKPASNVYMDR